MYQHFIGPAGHYGLQKWMFIWFLFRKVFVSKQTCANKHSKTQANKKMMENSKKGLRGHHLGNNIY
jgi:hypothetical protein